MTLWQVYGFIIAEFLFEYSVFAVLFLHKLNRRKLFVLRAVLSFLAIFAIGLPVAYFYKAFGGTLWGRILVYLFLFAAFTLLTKVCFCESYLTLLFGCSMAYAAQNIAYKVYLIIWTTGEQLRLYDGWGSRFDLYYRLVYYFIFAVCVVGSWFLFIRRITAKMESRKLNFKILLISFFILGITVLLCSVEDLSFADLSVIRENRFDHYVYFVLRQTSNAFSVVCCIIVLSLASKAIIENELLQEVEYLKYTIRQGERQYQISKDNIELINIKCHDIKYKLDSLAAQGGMTPEAVKELRDSISIYDSKTETGNQLLNVLITEKSLYCEQNGINLSCMVDGAKLRFMETGDLYCLFGNLIDNALEAVKKIEERERRVINLMVKSKDNLLLVQEENYFNGTLTFEDGLPVTTKEDKSSHGFGMRSLRMIVKKYGGELTASVTDDIFHLNIIFSR
ncbi:MAG: GHKL domain-containing protein [Clostridia bacterium]|nr:GHKL domain-containing protein [Clostridia bacterium]